MKKTINKKISKFVEEVLSNFEIDVPDEQIYLFETGIRRSISIRPIMTTWKKEQENKPEEIYNLQIICVHNSYKQRIDFHEVRVSEIENILNSKDNGDGIKSILEFILRNKNASSIRTKEQFLQDLNYLFAQINESAGGVILN